MRVVFWKDAAERKLCRDKDTSKIPMTMGGALARPAPRLYCARAGAVEVRDRHHVAGRELRPAAVADAHAAEHLPDDDLDVFDGDACALQLVYFDDLGHHVLLCALLARVFEELLQIGGAVGQELAFFDAGTNFDRRDAAEVRLVLDSLAAFFAGFNVLDVRSDDYHLFLSVIADLDNLAGDGRDNRRGARHAALEDFLHPRGGGEVG